MLSHAEAEELTNLIRDGWNQTAASVEYVALLMREAIQRQAWKVLGRDSVAEWAQDYFGEALLRMDRAMRGEMILELTAAHVSTREIRQPSAKASPPLAADNGKHVSQVTHLTLTTRRAATTSTTPDQSRVKT